MARPSKDEYFMEMVRLVAKRSTCLRRAVGCVLVNKRGHVLATGYNGVAAGMPHCNEVTHYVRQEELIDTFSPIGTGENKGGVVLYPVYRNACPGAKAKSGSNLDGCGAIHAEQNALLQCRDVFDIHTAYVSVSPCVTCTKLLMNTSAERVVFAEEYVQPMAKELWLRKHGREDAWSLQKF